MEEGKNGSIVENEPVINEISAKEILRIIIHELLEIMLADIGSHLSAFYAQEYIAQLIHAVIRRLEHVLLEKKPAS